MDDKTREVMKIWVAVATLVVAIIGVIVAVWIRTTVVVVRSDIEQVGNRVERVEKSVMENQFRVTYPSDGDSVGLTSVVRGETPFLDMNHYIVVTPVEVGIDFVQDETVRIYTGGSWAGRAGFGDAAVGVGQQFLVRSMATTSIVSPGPLTEVPEDAKFSEAITVTRKE